MSDASGNIPVPSNAAKTRERCFPGSLVMRGLRIQQMAKEAPDSFSCVCQTCAKQHQSEKRRSNAIASSELDVSDT